MKVDRILVSVGPGETRIAALEDGYLVSLTLERDGEPNMVGDIFIGRVETVVENLQAAFIDIGREVSGFLGLAGAHQNKRNSKDTISNHLTEGDLVLVQVTGNPEANKGPKLTLNPVLSGRRLAFLPGQSGISVSRRINNPAEQARLKGILTSRVLNLGGFIIRTAARESETKELLAEAKHLETKWSKIQSIYNSSRRPQALMAEIPPSQCLLRDINVSNLTALVTDNAENYNELKAYAAREIPEILDLICLYRGKEPLFQTEGIDELIETAGEPFVSLPNGGNIKITETEALVAVDVNTGKATTKGRDQMIRSVNCQAAEIFAKEMRLRNLGGLIVIDFIKMRNRAHQEDVLNTLRRAVADDPQQPFIGGFTRFGLVEMTRRRKGASLSAILYGRPKTPEKSVMTSLLDALRLILVEASAAPSSHFILKISKEMQQILEKDLRAALTDVEARIGGRLKLESSETLKSNTYIIQTDYND